MERTGCHGPGSKIKVELNGGVILDTDLGQAHDFMQPYPEQGLTSGYFGLTGIEGPVEFRKIEIMELNTEGSPSSTVAAVGSARVLFVDEFDDPKSGWAHEPADQRQKNPKSTTDTSTAYTASTATRPGPGGSGRAPREGFLSSRARSVGRVYGENPTGSGAMILLVGSHGQQLAGHYRHTAVDSTSSTMALNRMLRQRRWCCAVQSRRDQDRAPRLQHDRPANEEPSPRSSSMGCRSMNR